MKGYSTAFTKYHGNGNDFIVFDLVHHDDAHLYQSIIDKTKNLCDRHRGIGSDGVIIVQRRDGQWCMTLINADGSIASNCGNGLRCAALHLSSYDDDKNPVILFAGRTYACRLVREGVAVHMGACMVTELGETVLDSALGPTRWIRGNIGNEHVVYLIDNVIANYENLLAPIERQWADAHQLNIGFLWRDAVGRWCSHVYERGVGFTKSCGTGAIMAATFISVIGEIAGKSVVIYQPGGPIKITITSSVKTDDGFRLDIEQQGSAEVAFKGICQVSDN